MKFRNKLSITPLSLFFGLVLLMGLSMVSCKKESEKKNEGEKEKITTDEYYVKYEVNSTTIYYGGKLDVTLSNETNEPTIIRIDQRKPSEIIIGPVQKGFKATLKVVAVGGTQNHLKLYANIYVSKNNSPFALKKTDGSDTPRDSVELNYTIDY